MRRLDEVYYGLVDLLRCSDSPDGSVVPRIALNAYVLLLHYLSSAVRTLIMTCSLTMIRMTRTLIRIRTIIIKHRDDDRIIFTPHRNIFFHFKIL